MKAKYNLLFLDIDGVLNNKSDYTMYGTKLNNKLYGLSESCIKNLSTILLETNLKVVISSSWRSHPSISYVTLSGYNYVNPLPKLLELINQYLFTYTLPRNHNRKYVDIDEFITKYRNLINKVVILDDLNNQGLSSFNTTDFIRFYRTDQDYGLTTEISREIIEFINN